MKQRISLALMIGALVGTSSAFAQATLTPVVVTGFRATYGGFGWSGFDFGGAALYSLPPGGSPFPGYYELVATINQAAALQSVRCSANGDLRNTTSLSSPEQRWLAAEQVFRALNQTLSTWQRIFGRGPFSQGYMTVVFADNGQEKYMVISPLFTSAFPEGPMPGSLVKGDGVVKPHPICH